MSEFLWVNTASGKTLGLMGIVPLIIDTESCTFVHNSIICTKLKQSLIIGLDFAQIYIIGGD